MPISPEIDQLTATLTESLTHIRNFDAEPNKPLFIYQSALEPDADSAAKLEEILAEIKSWEFTRILSNPGNSFNYSVLQNHIMQKVNEDARSLIASLFPAIQNFYKAGDQLQSKDQFTFLRQYDRDLLAAILKIKSNTTKDELTAQLTKICRSRALSPAKSIYSYGRDVQNFYYSSVTKAEFWKKEFEKYNTNNNTLFAVVENAIGFQADIDKLVRELWAWLNDWRDMFKQKSMPYCSKKPNADSATLLDEVLKEMPTNELHHLIHSYERYCKDKDTRLTEVIIKSDLYAVLQKHITQKAAPDANDLIALTSTVPQ